MNVQIRFRNTSSEPIQFLIEPLGDARLLKPNRSVVVGIHGDQPPNEMVEIEYGPKSITIFTWSGSLSGIDEIDDE